MSNTTAFNINDMVFIENIGYGTLMDCGNLKAISVKQVPSSLEKKQSIYFDPELFNSDSDNLGRRKSQCAVLVPNPKLEKPKQADPLPQIQKAPSKSSEQEQSKSPIIKEQPKISIVKVRLQGTTSLVYTPHTNIRKYVIVPVRPLFLPAIGTLNIKIEIGKTIQSFKKQIFDLLGLKHTHYFNVKLYTTSPHLIELNCPGKTVWQYGIRESSVLTMVAEHGFCFQAVPNNLGQYFSVTNNNLTFVALQRKPKVVQNVVIALPAQPQTTQASTSTEQPAKTESPKKQPKPQNQQQKPQVQKIQVQQPTSQLAQNKVQQKKQDQKTQQTAENTIQKIFEPPQTLILAGDKVMRSGKQYFQVRLDKLPHTPAHFKIGLMTENKAKRWLFVPLCQQKIVEEGSVIKSTESYGMIVKQNDSIGVLTKIDKSKNMKVIFFKNNINLGVCFEQKIEQIIFVFQIGSEGQISLDSRVQPPIDSYRFR